MQNRFAFVTHVGTALVAGLAAAPAVSAENSLSPRSSLARSLLPEPLREDALVIELTADGETVVQEGSGEGFICVSDDQRPGRMGLLCHHPALAEINAVGRAVAASGLRGAAFLTETCRRAEARGIVPPDGSLEISASVALREDGSFESTMTVYHLLWVPHSSTKTIGIRDTDPGDGSAWLHQAGTCQSHVMWSEERDVRNDGESESEGDSDVEPLADMVQGRAAFSPSGDSVAFIARARRDGSDYRLYVASSDGTSTRRLNVPAGTIKAPDWSPDGKTIAFSGQHDGQTETYVIGSDGRNLERLTYHEAEDGEPSWSPDGSRILFCSNRTGTYQLYLMNTDGTGVLRLFENDANEFQPEWAPDGRIAFVSDRDGSEDIWVSTAEGALTQITSGPARDHGPAFSPDGSRIAFHRCEPGCNGDWNTYVVNVDGSDLRQLTDSPGEELYPDWSPDGSALIVESHGNESNWLRLYEVTTQNSKKRPSFRLLELSDAR